MVNGLRSVCIDLVDLQKAIFFHLVLSLRLGFGHGWMALLLVWVRGKSYSDTPLVTTFTILHILVIYCF
jgi:hypothetical protein